MMELPQPSHLATLESNLDQLIHELHQLATRVKQHDQHSQRDDAAGEQGQYLIASGRS